MEVYSLKQKIFIVKNFYQNGNSFERVKSEFAYEFKKTKLPTDSVIVELLQLYEQNGSVITKNVENKVNSQSPQCLENMDIVNGIKCEAIQEDEKWALFTGNGIFEIKTEPELLLYSDAVDTPFLNDTENRCQRLRTNEHSLDNKKFPPYNCDKDTDDDESDLKPLSELRSQKILTQPIITEETFEFKEIKEEHNHNELEKIDDTDVKCNKIINEVVCNSQKLKTKSKTTEKTKRVRPKKTFKCEECNKVLKRKRDYVRHIRTHEQSCKIGSIKYRDYESHMITHTEDKPHACTECGVHFKTRSNLKIHMLIHTNERPFECDLCKKTFKSNNHVYRHMKTHKERQKKCEICGKGFVRNSELENHHRTHTGEKPFVCSFCGKCFAVRYSLIAHNRIHTEEMSYKCNLCDKQFKVLGTLKMHKRRIHTREKPFKCKFCEKAFCDGTTRRDHERIHTGDYPYKCVLCGKGHNHPSNLKYHMRYVHKATTSAAGFNVPELL